MKLLTLLVLFMSFSSFAQSRNWKDRLYCYGGIMSGSDLVVELERAVDQDGLIRNVYFQSDVNRARALIATSCTLEGSDLLCGNGKIKVRVKTANRFSAGMWDAARYTYYETEVSKKGLISSKTEEIRCRL
jgi:hypothetical protein